MHRCIGSRLSRYADEQIEQIGRKTDVQMNRLTDGLQTVLQMKKRKHDLQTVLQMKKQNHGLQTDLQMKRRNHGLQITEGLQMNRQVTAYRTDEQASSRTDNQMCRYANRQTNRRPDR